MNKNSFKTPALNKIMCVKINGFEELSALFDNYSSLIFSQLKVL